MGCNWRLIIVHILMLAIVAAPGLLLTILEMATPLTIDDEPPMARVPNIVDHCGSMKSLLWLWTLLLI